VAAEEMLTLLGVTLTLMEPDGAMVTGTDAETVASATLVAVTVAAVFVETVGAV
jgi:hypothetical protein